MRTLSNGSSVVANVYAAASAMGAQRCMVRIYTQLNTPLPAAYTLLQGLASLVALSGAGRAGASMHAPAAPAVAPPAAAPALAPEPSITISPAARQEEGEVEEGELEEGELSPGPKRPKLHAD